MILNNKAQMFSLWFPEDFFYPEVIKRWSPIIQSMKLPFQSVTDFMNSQIQQVSYPGVDIGTSSQEQGQFPIEYSIGKELEPILNKDFTVTFRLTEGYYTYFILLDQVKYFLQYREHFSQHRVFMSNFNITFLNDAGFSIVNYKYKYIVPRSLGNFTLSYAAQMAQYNTITWDLHYNRMDMDIL